MLGLAIASAFFYFTRQNYVIFNGFSGFNALRAPVIFGITVLVMWEALVRGLEVSPIILPAPTAIAAMVMPSMIRYGKDSRIIRSMNAPGSPSSALQMM